jgi:hypothetical protein
MAGRAGAGVSAALGKQEAAEAMRLLKPAVAMGYRNSYLFRTESALDSLRGRPDFRLLLLDLSMPAEPFARAN